MNETALMRLDPAIQQQIAMEVEARVGAALQRQRTDLMNSTEGFKAAMETAEQIAYTGILGTNNKGIVLKLYMLARDEGLPITQVQGRWYVWEQGGKIVTQRKAESMLADYRHRGGRVKWVETSPTRVEAWFKASPGEEPVRVVCDEETIKGAGLGGKNVQKAYGEDMKVWYVIRRGVRRTMPECQTGDPMPFDGGIDVVSDDFDVPTGAPQAPERPYVDVSYNASVADPDFDDTTIADPTPAEPVVDVIGKLRKAAKKHAAKWLVDGKPSFEPAWQWLTIITGIEVTAPAEVPPELLDKAVDILEMGGAEVEQLLKDDADQRAAGAVVEGEFEEAPAIDDDPFGKV